MSIRWCAVFLVSCVLLGLWLVAVPRGAEGGEVTFIRGDANGDGAVSLADVEHAVRLLVDGIPPSACREALDANDDAYFTWADPVFAGRYLFMAGSPFPPPFPVPGIDPTAGGIACEGGPVMEDPSAEIEVLVEAGGTNRRVLITLAVSSSRSLAGYSVTIRDAAAVIDLVETPGEQGTGDLTGVFGGGSISYFSTNPGAVIRLGGLVNFDPFSGALPPGTHIPLFRFAACLKPGTPPGEYALTVDAAAFADFDSGQTILPARLSGIIRVLETIDGECAPEPPPPPPGDSPFIRGDANADGRLSISDAVTINRFIFDDGLAPSCLDSADVDDSGSLDLSDEALILADAFWSHRLLVPPPFPTRGLDLTPDDLSCNSYVVEPAPATGDLIRVGNVTAAPGEEVEIPVFLSTSVDVEAIQLVLRFDPSVFIPVEDRRGEAFSFSGAPWEPQAEFASVLVLDPEGIMLVGVAGSLGSSLTPPIPPGDDQFVFSLKGQVSPEAQPGTEILIEPDNGPNGEGVRPPLSLLNEVTHEGEARHVSFLPRIQGGVLAIVGDVTFFRGDSNSDLEVDIADAVFVLNFLFIGGSQPICMDAADADDNGRVEITDPITILGELFLEIGAIAAPYPARGVDPTSDSLPRCRG